MRTNKLLKPANRLKFYKRLLEVVCKDPRIECGYCHFIERVYHIEFGGDDTEIFWCGHIGNLPELLHYRPLYKFNSEFWFPRTAKGWEKRIAILEKVIFNMENNLNYYL